MTWQFNWSHGNAFIEPVGAMCGPVWFKLDNGQTVQPFSVFPWADEPAPVGHEKPVGLLARGRGEWPCVPFGYEDSARQLPPEIKSLLTSAQQDPPHGLPSHHQWQLEELHDGFAALNFTFPENHALKSIQRTITGVDGMAKLLFGLTINARHECHLPIGLHPTLSLPTTPGAAEIIVEDYEYGLTYPCAFETDASVTAHHSRFEHLTSVPGIKQNALDLSHLPHPKPFEDAVLLKNTNGIARLINHEQDYQVKVIWPSEHLPDLMLWMSCAGRQYYPWSGRHFGLGIEPVCSAFDLGQTISQQPNPYNQQGGQTSIHFKPDVPFCIQYSIEIMSL